MTETTDFVTATSWDRKRRWRWAPGMATNCSTSAGRRRAGRVAGSRRSGHRAMTAKPSGRTIDDGIEKTMRSRHSLRMPGPVRTSPPRIPLTLGDLTGGERPPSSTGGRPVRAIGEGHQRADQADAVVQGGHLPARQHLPEPHLGEVNGDRLPLGPEPLPAAGAQGRRPQPTLGLRAGGDGTGEGRRPCRVARPLAGLGHAIDDLDRAATGRQSLGRRPRPTSGLREGRRRNWWRRRPLPSGRPSARYVYPMRLSRN